jgi:hypothetical protein
MTLYRCINVIPISRNLPFPSLLPLICYCYRQDLKHFIFCDKKAEHKMKFGGRKYNKAEHWFDEECMLKKRETNRTSVEYKVKDDDVSRFKYWECRKEYYNILEKNKKSWQEEQSDFLDNLIKQKEVKKI